MDNETEKRPDAHRPRPTTNQMVGAGLDHPSVDRDPGGDELPHPSNRIDFNNPTSHLTTGDDEATNEAGHEGGEKTDKD